MEGRARQREQEENWQHPQLDTWKKVEIAKAYSWVCCTEHFKICICDPDYRSLKST